MEGREREGNKEEGLLFLSRSFLIGIRSLLLSALGHGFYLWLRIAFAGF